MARNHGKRRRNYAVDYPYISFNIGQTFFFFNSLLEKTSPHGQNGATGAMLGDEVIDTLANYNNNLSNIIGDYEDQTIITQAMDFLKATIEKEREHEQEYFSSHFKNNEKLPIEMRNEIDKCFNDDGTVDYLKFISLINIFYSGVEEYQNNLNYETQRLKDLNRYMTEYKQFLGIQRKKGILNVKRNIEEEEKEFFTNFKSFLIDKIQYNKDKVAQSVLSKRTLSNEIQDQFSNIFYACLESPTFMKTIEAYVQNITTTPDEIREYAAFTLASLMSFQASHIQDFLQKRIIETGELDKDRIEDLVNDITEQIQFYNNPETINSKQDEEKRQAKRIYDNLKQIHSHIKKISTDNKLAERTKKRMIKEIDLNEVISAYDKDNKHSRGNVLGLSSKILKEMEEDIEYLEKTYNLNSSNNSKVKNKQKGLKSRLINVIRRKIADQEKRPLKSIKHTEIAKEIKKYFGSINIFSIESGKGNQNRYLSELSGAVSIAGAIQNDSGIQNLVKKEFVKNDAGTIELGSFSLIPNFPKEEIDDLINSLVETYQQEEEIYNRELINSLTEEIIYNDEIQRNFPSQRLINLNNQEDTYRPIFKTSYTSDEFFVLGETQKRLIADEKEYEAIKLTLESQNKSANEIKAILKEIKNSFKISTTVKNYDKYDNDVGFKAGSLGGSVETQLNNLMDMFLLGGITPPDFEWLLLAIYNSSPGTLGTDLKDPLEELFTTIAIMLLFDDAGQQAEYIKTQAYNNIEVASNKALHLYLLNGIYFPASFILELTYNGLEKGQELLQSTAHLKKYSNGSHLNIINNINEEDDMVGGENIFGQKVVTSAYDWRATFENAKGDVTLQLTFLAGFLDILNEIQTAMTQFIS